MIPATGSHSPRQHPDELGKRLAYLDGLRGSAALIVVVHHFFCAFVPSLVPVLSATPSRVADTPVALLWNGTFSVIIFFVLSGFVVSNSAAKPGVPLWLKLVLRYTRLTLPAVASVAFAWALYSIFRTQSLEIFTRFHHDWFDITFHGVSMPGFGAALFDGFVGIYKHRYSNFNNVLWTMRLELVGSIGIYTFYAIRALRNHRLIALCVLFAVLVVTGQIFYIGFCFGCIIRELFITGRVHRIAPWLGCAVGCIMGFASQGFSERMRLPHPKHLLTFGDQGSLFYPVGAALIVYAFISSTALQKTFSARPYRFLGRISFALYLVHVPLLCSVFAGMYLRTARLGRLQFVALLPAFLITSIVAGYLGTIAVDEPVLRLNSLLRRLLTRRRRHEPLAATAS